MALSKHQVSKTIFQNRSEAITIQGITWQSGQSKLALYFTHLVDPMYVHYLAFHENWL